MTSRDGIDTRSIEQELEVFSSEKIRGSALGKTDPQKRQVVAGGVDYCRFFAYGVEAPADLFAKIASERQAAEERGELRDLYTTFGNDRREWRVLPGDGVGVCRMAFVLQRGPVRIGFRQRGESTAGPVAVFELTGTGCGGLKPVKIYEIGAELLTSFGVQIHRTTMNRVDVHGDLRGVSVSEFVHCEETERCVRRAISWDPKKRGKQWQTINVGRRGGDVFCRIYDKAAELSKAGNEEKAKAYCETWGFDSVPPDLVRVEFELRAERFGGQDARTVLRMLDRYVCYCFEQWLRFTDGPVDRRNVQRSKGGVVWEALKAGIVERLEKASEVLPELRKAVPNVKRVIRAGLGAIASLAALVKADVESMEDGLVELIRYAGVGDEDWLVRRTRERAKEYAVKFAGLLDVVSRQGGDSASGTQWSGGVPGSQFAG